MRLTSQQAYICPGVITARAAAHELSDGLLSRTAPMYASCLLATGLRVVVLTAAAYRFISSMPFITYYVRESLLQQVSERPRSTSRTLTEMRASQPACPPLHEHPAGAAPIFLRIQFPDMRSGAQAAVCKHSLSALWAGTASCLLPCFQQRLTSHA